MACRFRTLWISDTHLGGKNLNSEKLYDFLKKTESEYLYLVGDIFDLWKLKKGGWHWPEINDKIVQLIMSKAKAGTKVYYIPGNHDDAFRQYAKSEVSGVRFENDMIHITASGQKLLVMHGDQFDCVVQNRKWLADLGSFLYDSLLEINRLYNLYRSLRGKEYFSISAYLKHRCKQAVNYMGDFETTIVEAVKKRGVNGIICGHIHNASLFTMGRYLYGNSGDWVESCTALAENEYGNIGIIQWAVQPLGELESESTEEFTLGAFEIRG